MSIPSGHKLVWTAEVTAFKAKEVRCARCGTRYLYDMKRKECGQAATRHEVFSEETEQVARDRALANVDQKLDLEIDPVPCPDCGDYQPDMVALLRRRYHRWMGGLGGALLVAAAALFASGVTLVPPYGEWLLAGAGAAALAGACLVVLRGCLLRRYDPNAGDPAERLEYGQSRAYRPEDAGRIADDRPRELNADRRGREAAGALGAAVAFACLGALLLPGAAALAVLGALDLLHAAESRDWPKASGKAQRNDREVVRAGRTVTAVGDVAYTYEVGGRVYRGTRVWFGPFSPEEKVRRAYPSGASVEVYHHPDDPALAVLRPGVRWPQTYQLALFGGLGLLAAAVCLGLAGARHREYRDLRRKTALIRGKMWRGSTHAAAGA